MNKSRPQTIPNVLAMGVEFKAGGWYGVTWYYNGDFVMNELCKIPERAANPRKYFDKWILELTQYLTLPVVDVHVKQMEMS